MESLKKENFLLCANNLFCYNWGDGQGQTRKVTINPVPESYNNGIIKAKVWAENFDCHASGITPDTTLAVYIIY